MKAYLYYYGDIHRQKLLKAYSKLPEYIFSRNFSVIDWGCGQGLGPIILDEFIAKEKKLSDRITDILDRSIHKLSSTSNRVYSVDIAKSNAHCNRQERRKHK